MRLKNGMVEIGLKSPSGCDNPDVYCKKTSSLSVVPAIWSSLLMAVAGMGDAFLYAYLPAKGEAIGLSIFSIGLLLSINKFVRFFFNRWIAWMSHRYGLKRVLFLGFLLSVVTTFTYGLNPALWVWIVSRVIWGAAYSAVRFSTIQYADNAVRPGGALGIGRTIQELGPLLAYWIGPTMLSALGATETFATWAFFSIAMMPVFLYLPDPDISGREIRLMGFQGPTWMDVWVFCAAFITEGLLIVGISKLVPFHSGSTEGLVLISAIYISVRRVMVMMVSPLAGWVSDRFGFHRPFHLSGFLIVAGLIALSSQFNTAGILLAFLGSAINFTLIPLVALKSGSSHKIFEALTRLSTSRDIGSAIGSLTGLALLVSVENQPLFLVLTVIITSVWIKIRNLKP